MDDAIIFLEAALENEETYLLGQAHVATLVQALALAKLSLCVRKQSIRDTDLPDYYELNVGAAVYDQ